MTERAATGAVGLSGVRLFLASATTSRANDATHYRADVDGLRALAVIPVVLFHAGFGFVSGGFVGVDVFFVISGFLITGILAREIAAGHYSILEFYRRRARRIFPALTAMTLATLVAGYVVLMPAEYVEVAKSAAALSIFSSNVFFWQSASYFQSAHEFKPLLHSWSLAVEEQYYVFFPLLLRLLNLRQRRLVAALWIICIGSLALAVIFVPWKPSAAFYLLPTRAWELMLGGLLAVGKLPKPPSRLAASAGSLAGLLLIAVPMLAYTAATPFPGLTAIPPTLGTALVIWAGGEGVVGELLSRGGIVAIGQASYSIYLWHLPVLAFANYLVDGPLSTTTALLLCAVSIALGFASLVWIELPFRSPSPMWSRNQAAAYAACGMVITGLVSLSIIGAHGFPARIGTADGALIAVAGDKYRHHAECMTVDQNIVRPDHACRLGTTGVVPSALLWGDSHSMVTATALEAAARRHHASFLFAADADCPPGLGFEIDPTFDPGLTRQLSYRYCADYNQAMFDLAIRTPAIKTVIFSARWTNWRIGAPPNPVENNADVRLRDSEGTAASLRENRMKWERGFFSLVDRLTSNGKRVVIVGPVPEPSFDVPHRLYVQRFGLTEPSRDLALSGYRLRHQMILRIFDQLRQNQRVTFVWPVQALCVADKCPIVERGRPLFFDHDHLSIYGAKKTSSLYDPVFQER